MDEIKKQYIDGTQGGSGTYTFRAAKIRSYSASVAHMPEDTFCFRIMLHHHDSIVQNISLNREFVHCLYAALKRTAEDMNWSDEFEPSGQ